MTKIQKPFDKVERLFLGVPLSLLSDSNQRPRDYKSRALANWAKEAGGKTFYITPLRPTYPCCVQTLGDSKGAGCVALSRVQKYKLFITQQVFSAFFLLKVAYFSMYYANIKSDCATNWWENDSMSQFWDLNVVVPVSMMNLNYVFLDRFVSKEGYSIFKKECVTYIL